MILLTLSRGKGEETVRLQLPASPAEIGETFAFLDRISLDTTATAILDVSSNVPVLYRCLYDVDVEDSEQFQKLQKLAERTEALSPAKAAIFSGALDAECVWNLEGALTVADRLDEYMLVNNVSSDSELGIYLVNKGITPFPDRFKPYINYARVGAEYDQKENSCEIFEIKHSSKQVPFQYRHLVDEDKCQRTERRFGPIHGRYILYRGEDAQMENGVQYWNVENYLKALPTLDIVQVQEIGMQSIEPTL